MDVQSTDAAFGPQLGSAPIDPTALVGMMKELQQLLNMRGYGPVQVTGTLDAATHAAAKSAGIDLNTVTPNAAVEMLKAPTVTQVPPAPLWKQPKYLLMGAAILGVVGYVAWRAGALKGLGLGDASPEELPEDMQHAKQVSGVVTKRRSQRPPKEKCSVLPTDEGEPLAPPEE